jgi:aspartate/methionine/tyrosine aminotransferase
MTAPPSESSSAAPGVLFVSPFQRLASLLEGVAPGLPPIVMAIGEPRHPVPAFVGPVIAGEIAGFGKYPAIKGTDAFRAAVAGWLERRYSLGGSIDAERMVLPLNGSREGLFFAALEARRASAKRPTRPMRPAASRPDASR